MYSCLLIDIDFQYIVVYLFGSAVGKRNYGLLAVVITVHFTKYLPVIK